MNTKITIRNPWKDFLSKISISLSLYLYLSCFRLGASLRSFALSRLEGDQAGRMWLWGVCVCACSVNREIGEINFVLGRYVGKVKRRAKREGLMYNLLQISCSNLNNFG